MELEDCLVLLDLLENVVLEESEVLQDHRVL